MTTQQEQKPSFGKYFDDQRDRLQRALQNKNTQLNNAWRERYDEREKKEKEQRMKKELEECSDKGVTEISQECKTFYKKEYESEKKNETKENSERV